MQFQGMTIDELTQALGSRSRALKAMAWLYQQPLLDDTLPPSLPAVSKSAWGAFAESHSLAVPQVLAVQQASDGTSKWSLGFDDAVVETVRIPGPRRSTVCVSSQAGCTRRCAFCATPQLGFRRNLTAAEIIAQFQLARADAPADKPATNVVFMGMGEPFDNLDEVLRAVRILTEAPGLGLRQRSVTVSTSGVLPGLKRFLTECDASLALSLNATTDEVRTQIMPQNRTWPIASLLEALRADAARTGGKRITFVEYVVLAGLNDSDADMTRLAALLRGIPARVNFIPFNPHERTVLRAPTAERVRELQRLAMSAGLRCMIRWPRGETIAAACGQLCAAMHKRKSLGASEHAR